MILKGWTKELPAYIIKAIHAGDIKIHKAKDYEYLIGETVNPQGMIVSFK